MGKTISVFNNKGGVGKTTIIWNLAVSLADKNKNILLIDFDPQCNLSIACIGDSEFANLLSSSDEFPFGKTIKAFAFPYIHQNRYGEVYTVDPKKKCKNGVLHIVPGDFWLNNLSDILNVGNDVVNGAGLYRFILPTLITQRAEKENNITYDYVLIDLPPSFNTLVRASLYCSDYFIVPCTPDLFSAYCVGLIGEVLPNFVTDWELGYNRYLENNVRDEILKSKGKPRFGGWVFNGFDTRKQKEVGADALHHLTIEESINNKLINNLRKIESYDTVPNFVTEKSVANVEDLNVMASDSIFQNIPISYLSEASPSDKIGNRRQWATNQIDLMNKMVGEYKKLADYIIANF